MVSNLHQWKPFFQKSFSAKCVFFWNHYQPPSLTTPDLFWATTSLNRESERKRGVHFEGQREWNCWLVNLLFKFFSNGYPGKIISQYSRLNVWEIVMAWKQKTYNNVINVTTAFGMFYKPEHITLCSSACKGNKGNILNSVVKNWPLGKKGGKKFFFIRWKSNNYIFIPLIHHIFKNKCAFFTLHSLNHIQCTVLTLWTFLPLDPQKNP